MKVYIYQAALLCEDCGIKTREYLNALAASRLVPINPIDETTYDSDDYPKGPYPADASDHPDHCDHCGLFLENPLTVDGYEYMIDCVLAYHRDRKGNGSVIELWSSFYDVLICVSCEARGNHDTSLSNPADSVADCEDCDGLGFTGLARDMVQQRSKRAHM